MDFGRKDELPIPPYILGIWLGDGTSAFAGLTSMDDEIIQEWVSYGKDLGLDISVLESTNKGRAKTYNFVIPENFIKENEDSGHYKNKFNLMLANLSIKNNKHIPEVYKNSSTKSRLELLAGLIDTDGSLGRGCFDFVNKRENLVTDMVRVIRSLGLSSYISECEKSCITREGKFTGKYYRIGICGNINRIPTKTPRKQASERIQPKSVLVSHIDVIESEPQIFFTFILDKPTFGLLNDFTVVKI